MAPWLAWLVEKREQSSPPERAALCDFAWLARIELGPHVALDPGSQQQSVKPDAAVSRRVHTQI